MLHIPARHAVIISQGTLQLIDGQNINKNPPPGCMPPVLDVTRQISTFGKNVARYITFYIDTVIRWVIVATATATVTLT